MGGAVVPQVFAATPRAPAREVSGYFTVGIRLPFQCLAFRSCHPSLLSWALSGFIQGMGFFQ